MEVTVMSVSVDVIPVENTFTKEKNSTHERRLLKTKTIWDCISFDSISNVPGALLKLLSR
jgi:hypothetical protein